MFRFGICNELFEGWEFGRVCRTVKALGYDGLELAPFTLAPTITDLSPERRRELRTMIRDAGLATIGLHWLLAKTEGLYLTHPDPSVRRRTADYLKALGEATRDLGGNVMVLGSPRQRDLLPGVDHATACDYAAEVLGEALPTIGAAGVELCLEPLAPTETDFLNTIAQANDLIARIGHPALRLHLDVKAQSSDPGGSVPDLFARFAPTAGHVHVQDPNGRGPGMGATDFGPILWALVQSGYDRWVSVEVFDYAPGADETARKSLECLRRAMAPANPPGERGA